MPYDGRLTGTLRRAARKTQHAERYDVIMVKNNVIMT